MAYEKFAKMGLTPEKLAALYLTHTDAQIASVYGVAEITVRRWRRKADVETLTEGQRKDVGREGLRFEDLTPERLRELSETHTDEEIGAMYGRSKFPVRHLRERFGIDAARHGRRPQEGRPQVQEVLLGGALNIFTDEPGAPVGQEPVIRPHPLSVEERRAREAEQARVRRAKMRETTPAKTTRTFTCSSCGKVWETAERGNFRTCPGCREAATVIDRTKTCTYVTCGKSFVDTSSQKSMSYCSEECRRRAKVERTGGPPVGGFLADQVRSCQNPACGKSFTPESATQKFCSFDCRAVVYSGGDEARKKVCSRCGGSFVDASPKNNQRAHPACSRKVWDKKAAATRPLEESPRLARRRKERVRLGDGGRLDDVGTMTKFTHSWWGRVSEMVFAAYRIEARDVNESNGSRSPYDFDDPEFRRVDVRSCQERTSPQGRPMWVFQVAGLRESSDHAFLVGYAGGGEHVAYLWLVPSSDLNESFVRLAPGSLEYVGDKWDVTPKWGTMAGNRILARVLSLPDPVKPEHRFAWVGGEENFTGGSATHRGRRGEFLYKTRYPDSVDVNERDGMLAHHDFEDADGTRVNVKTSRRHPRSDRPGVMKWSFSLLAVHQVAAGHQCDVYSCLCLDETGTKALRELRIPASVLGARRLIHVYDRPDDQWQGYVSG